MTKQGEAGAAAEAAWCKAERSDGGLTLALGGRWTAESAGDLDRSLSALDGAGAGKAEIDMSGITALDTAGAWLILRTQKGFEAKQVPVTVSGAKPAQAALLETVARQHVTIPGAPAERSRVIAFLERLGKTTVDIAVNARDLVNFLGLTVIASGRALRHPGRLRAAPLINQIERTGFDALPIVGLLAFLIGVVTAYQGADQLARFGAQIFTVNIVAIGVLREMGILITAIIVAGRSGSAYTAQIGTMKVNEEVDAMRTIGLDPIEILAVPRVLGLVLVMPLLTFYADIMGILGGAVMATVALDISIGDFMIQMRQAVSITSFWVGMVKAPLFAFVIALVGCFEGFQVTQSAESVGRHTTKAVVEGVFLVIVLDAFLSIFFSKIGW